MSVVRQRARRAELPVAQRSLMSGVRGLPWWGAVSLAGLLTAFGVFADLERIDRLGLVFQVAYFAGCVLAVCWAQRRALFGPMVQPPLLLAVAVPGVVLAASSLPPGVSLSGKLLVVGEPLLNGFPTMAITTGVCLVIGLVRLRLQRTGSVAPDARRTSPRR